MRWQCASQALNFLDSIAFAVVLSEDVEEWNGKFCVMLAFEILICISKLRFLALRRP